MRRKLCELKIIVGLCGACLLVGWANAAPVSAAPDLLQPDRLDGGERLASEVRGKGGICYSARSARGDWDLFLCRPDGSDVTALTRTPEYSEFSPAFSRDGLKMLYRRIPRGETIDGNHYGAQGELVLGRSDGSEAKALSPADGFPWASWSPDGSQVACLSLKGISLLEPTSGRVERTFPRKGIFQQLTWSPDGQWLLGVANSFGTSWSIARVNVATGKAAVINRVDCCTPDWFPDSKRVVFSWRPPGQKGNSGYGWTQLWQADIEGKSRSLVYGEDGRHVYGGHVSPDGRYVIFTGNMREDGDPGNRGAPMALMRLSDAPIIGGRSEALRALHPAAKDGPVLTLPVGWEPCWTSAEVHAHSRHSGPKPSLPADGKQDRVDSPPDELAQLASELRSRGWIVFSAMTSHGDWDLHACRPDGSDRRALTDTRDLNEAGARVSPDGSQLLYFRLPKAEPVDNNTYGTYELVISNANGSEPVVYGDGFPWASWGPSSKQLACLSPKGIQVIDLRERRIVRQLPRKGLVSQLVWSPDGTRFTGTANGLGAYWNIGCLNADSGEIHAVSETERYNCTPDWTPDARHIVYARGIIPEQGGRAELWVARAGDTDRHVLYAEAGRHIYGACVSPDGKYLLFTRSTQDLGKVDHKDTTMAIIRWSETPMIGDEDAALRRRLPTASSGSRWDLGYGWEPHWTSANIFPVESPDPAER